MIFQLKKEVLTQVWRRKERGAGMWRRYDDDGRYDDVNPQQYQVR